MSPVHPLDNVTQATHKSWTQLAVISRLLPNTYFHEREDAARQFTKRWPDNRRSNRRKDRMERWPVRQRWKRGWNNRRRTSRRL